MQFDARFRRFAWVSVITGVMIADALSVHPAAAAAMYSAIEGLVSCATTAACVSASNTAAGPGVSGASARGVGVTASGVTGLTATGTTGNAITASTTNGYGVNAVSRTGLGVRGSSTGYYGVEGTSTSSYGVRGVTTSGTAGVYGTAAGGDGVHGTSTSGTGVSGVSTDGYGLSAISTNGYGLYATTANTATANGKGAIDAYTLYGDGLDVDSEDFGRAGIFATDLNAIGTAIITKTQATNYNNWPFLALDTAGTWLFGVDGVGNVYYHGSLMTFARTGGGAVKTFTPESASPTLEDTGTAQLVGGAAAVRLDPTFAASIDARSPYHVFITPEGDTNGVYVAQKTAAGFVVRENKGGRSTVAFDYRIVASAAGQSGQRMAVVPASSRPFAARRAIHVH